MKKLLICLGLFVSACASTPPDPAQLDHNLAAQVSQALNQSPDVNGWNISAVSHDGNVTLTGSAGTFQQKQIAERIAKGVPGVKVVFNQIVIKE